MGRWPSNVLLDQHTAAQLDKQSGITTSTGGSFSGRRDNGIGYAMRDGHPINRPTDEGGASRFFPTFRYTPKAPTDERPSADGIAHPTVKPLELMRWLVRLVTPPHGIVLDPFAGTGTTGEAAIHEHKRAILIEREQSYLPLIVARLSKPMEVGFDFGEAI
jgi:site-specific DNA-methyltransferase (adenine-specific)